MIVCPLCESSQAQGDTCDRCGKTLLHVPPTSSQYPPLPDLEVTSLARDLDASSAEPMPELELHRFSKIDLAASDEAMPDVQRVAPAEEATAPTVELAGLEVTRFAPASPPVMLGEAATCRYCGHVQRRSRLCEKCANAMPSVMPEEPETTVTKRHCPACGFEGELGKICAACGLFLRPSEP